MVAKRSGGEHTSPRVAKEASKVLRSKSASKINKSIAGAALRGAGSPPKGKGKGR